MEKLNNLPIFARFTSAFGLVLLISVFAIGFLSYDYYAALVARDQAVQVSFNAQQTANFQQVSLQRMNSSLQARFAQIFTTAEVQDSALAASGALINNDILTRESDFDQTLQAYQQQYEFATSVNMSRVRDIVLHDDPDNAISKTQQNALAAVANGEWPSYKKLQDQVLSLLDPSSNPTLFSNPRLSYARAYTLLFEADQVFLGLKLDWQHVVDSAKTIGEIVTTVGPSQTQPVVWETTAAVLLTFLVISLTGYIVNSSITRPLRQLAALTRRIKAGDLSARARSVGRDEIFMVASSMNSMLDWIVQLLAEAQGRGDRLQSQIARVVQEVGVVGSGNLCVQADESLPDLGMLSRSFNFMIAALSNLIIHVKTVAGSVVSSTTLTAGVMSRLVESAEQQIMQMRQATSEVERMASASQSIAKRIEELSAVADQAEQTARKGTVSVQQTVEGMGRINGSVRLTAQKVHHLQERSTEITTIATVMTTIAQRTNKLALDAAVHAAMAGEAGMGFAEVATSIRALAEKAKAEAASIEAIVHNVRQDIVEVQRAIHTTSQEAESGAQQASQAGMALTSIFQAVQRQAREMTTIQQIAVRHVQLSDVVTQAMGSVSLATQHSSKTTGEIAQYIEQQRRAVALLRTSVEAFRVPDEQQRATRVVSGKVEQRQLRSQQGTSGKLATGNTTTPPPGARSLSQRGPLGNNH